MRTVYARDIYDEPSGKSRRRVRVFGGNSREDHRSNQSSHAGGAGIEIEWTTLLLVLCLLVETVFLYWGISKGLEFRAGLFYDPAYLKINLLLFLAVPIPFVLLFHHLVMVKSFQTQIMRLTSALGCSFIFFVASQISLMTSGVQAHIKVNRVNLYCLTRYKEPECKQSQQAISELTVRQRQQLSSNFNEYSRLHGKATPADMALGSLISRIPAAEKAQ